MSRTVNNLSSPGNPPVDGDRVEIINDGGVREIKIYHPKVPSAKDDKELMTMSFSAALSEINLGQPTNLTVTLVDRDGDPVNGAGTYYIPLMKACGAHVDLLEVTFNAGRDVIQVSPAEPGIYTVDVKNIRPMEPYNFDNQFDLLVRP